MREFDQIQFYEVDQAEFDKCYEDFKTGRFVFEVEETIFDPQAYKKFLDSIASETEDFVKRRNAAGALCGQEENLLLKDWHAKQAIKEELEGEEDEIAGGECQANVIPILCLPVADTTSDNQARSSM